ncbi:hypothetical protein BJY01DRAFT_252027 [Aspergillus pseudoustus]|uniref:Xylanolytic transcriptional activator regulatory domain-containing protein n=1 Tax=Aspergillus pseudoustus TaxID=1810923 RepID=A0ABR4J8B3_9EURO
MDEPDLLYLALFGVSLPFSYDSRLDQKSSDAYWKYCKRRIFLEAMEEPSFSSLEALTVLVLDISGMTNGPQVWGPLAVAAKHAVHLRAVRGHSLRTSTSEFEHEPSSDTTNESVHRERLFWAIYALDCYITITTAQKPEFTDQEVDHFRATRDIVWEEQSLATSAVDTAFAYQLCLCDVSRQVHHVYLEYAELREDSEAFLLWFNQFQAAAERLADRVPATISPAAPCTPSTAGRLSTTLHTPSTTKIQLFFDSLTVHLHGLMGHPAAELLNSPVYETARTESRRCCLLGVQSIVNTLAQLSDQTMDKLGWPAAWSAWVAARYLLVQASFGIALQTDHYTVLSQFIDRMGKKWQVACKYRWLLHQAVSELADNRVQPCGVNKWDKPGTPGSVLEALRDLRTPTSDLEDRFRVDPMLQMQTRQSIDRSPPPMISGEEGLQSNLLGESAGGQERMAGVGYAIPEQVGDQWFPAPLFASSAYQPLLLMPTWESNSETYLIDG